LYIFYFVSNESIVHSDTLAAAVSAALDLLTMCSTDVTEWAEEPTRDTVYECLGLAQDVFDYMQYSMRVWDLHTMCPTYATEWPEKTKHHEVIITVAVIVSELKQ
jgi:aldehyde:ferredoxin oxidoreductase